MQQFFFVKGLDCCAGSVGLGGGFGAENAAEAGARELDADEALAGLSGICDVHYTATG